MRTMADMERALRELNETLQETVGALVENGHEDLARQATGAFRGAVEAWADVTATRRVPAEFRNQLTALTTEVLLAAAAQPEIGIDAVVTPLDEITEMGYGAVVMSMRDLAMSVGSIAILAKHQPGEFEEHALEVARLVTAKRLNS